MIFRERKRWVFLGLPFTFTVYSIDEDMITINSGFLRKKEEDCYMYKVQDVTLSTSLFERLVRIGTVTCNTGDVTTPTLTLSHIRNARDIKNFILKQSEEERLKRRTLNTQNISAHPDHDCVIDDLHDLHDL